MSSIQRLHDLYADVDALEKAISLLNWDRQLLMPPGGGAARSAHVGVLTRMRHEALTSDQMQQALESADPQTEEERAVVRELRREVDSECKLPAELVQRKAQVSNDAYDTWKVAKANDQFELLAPYYEQLFDIARETAELLGCKNHIYDPLIDLFEPGATYADAKQMFEEIKEPIVKLVRELKERGKPNDDSFLAGNWDQARLRKFAEDTATTIGYDFNRGRLDVAPNAFCMNLSRGDVRMTTRASEFLKGIVSSSLHEMGHGLYEQGSPAAYDRTILAGGTSLGVHESQSRLWENIVGRSLPFWAFFLPRLQQVFPQLDSVTLPEFYRAVNKVQPEFIRVGADELTYNLHILVRFELEVEILTGAITIRDLPEAWNAKYTEYLGITPSRVSLGCIQDVHWSRGYVGYFPTYAMGNLIGGQIWKTMISDIGEQDSAMRTGDFSPILAWLQDKVYSQARLYTPKDLVIRVTGRAMEAGDWLDYAIKKYRAIGGLD